MPTKVGFDAGGNLYVADSGNNRVLRYNSPLTSDTVADAQYGQPNFTSETCNNGGLTASSLCGPGELHFDGAGNLFIHDSGNERVLAYLLPGDNTADFVFGSPNFTTNGGQSAASATTFHDSTGIAVDTAGNLWVSDYHNARAIGFLSPLTTDAVADIVLGEADFVSETCADMIQDLCLPSSVEADAQGDIWVADWFTGQVIKFDDPISSDRFADFFLGLPGPGYDYCYGPGVSASDKSICNPSGLAVSPDGRIAVSEQVQDRVLLFFAPEATDKVADRVIGQPTCGRRRNVTPAVSARPACACQTRWRSI